MDEVLKALLGAAMGGNSNQPQPNNRPANDNQAIIDLLGGILGGGNSPQAQPARPAQPAPSVEPGYSQVEENPIADLIGSIFGGMGGAERPVSPQAQPSGGSGNGIADLIGSLIGGGGGRQQSSGNGIADLIGSMIGGGAGMNAQRITPMAQMLSEKTGLSPIVAQAVVAFFLAKMIEFVGQRFSGGTQPALPQGRPQQAYPQSSSTVDLDHLLNNMHDEEVVNSELSNSDMARELASTTGLDEETATQSLQTLVMMVGEEKQSAQPAQSARPQSGGLDNLLDHWETR